MATYTLNTPAPLVTDDTAQPVQDPGTDYQLTFAGSDGTTATVVCLPANGPTISNGSPYATIEALALAVGNLNAAGDPIAQLVVTGASGDASLDPGGGDQ
jgi:hypothetical protein